MMTALKAKVKQNVDAKAKDTCIITPENEYKAFWDFVIFIVLIFSCVITPLQLAIWSEDLPSK